jgi:hypothetical protein
MTLIPIYVNFSLNYNHLMKSTWTVPTFPNLFRCFGLEFGGGGEVQELDL